MPRRRSSDIISGVLASAESLRRDIGSLPEEIRGGVRELVLKMVSEPERRRGRPPKIKGRQRRRGRPRKPRTEAAAPV
ncbi:hypothetical protein KEJ39_03760 [Candidatus Bathyarchaeota archaeon]|nr:hypothetical protein [Candidatus Bathyarchaeota archaeon]